MAMETRIEWGQEGGWKWEGAEGEGDGGLNRMRIDDFCL